LRAYCWGPLETRVYVTLEDALPLPAAPLPPWCNPITLHPAAFPSHFLQPYDMLGVVQQVVDDGEVFEIARDYAKNIITGAPSNGRMPCH